MFISAWAAKSLCWKLTRDSVRKLSGTFSDQNVGKTVGQSILNTNSMRFDNSKWPLVSLDKSHHPQMSHMELNLFKKHAKHLQVDRQKNIYDVIDSIEWSHLVTEAHLEKAINVLSGLKCDVKKLVDAEIAVLISATGCRCQMLSEARRNKYTNRLIQIIKRRGAVLGINARNALLSALIDNQIDVDIMKVLKQFESDGFVPDAQTYGQLSRIYARKSDLKGIVEIINHLRNKTVELPNQVLESMVHSLTSLGQVEKAKSVIEHVATSNVTLADSLKMAFTLAKAEHSDGENVLELLDEVMDVTFVHKYQISLYELLFSLARKGNLKAVLQLKRRLLSVSEDLGKHWRIIVYSRIRSFLSKEEENITAAALLLDLIPDNEKKSEMRFALTKQFLPSIQRMQIGEAVRVCTVFQKSNILRHPLRMYLNHVALNDPKNFYNLFAMYKRTSDFVELENRPHLQLPDAAHHFSELMKADTVERKVEHLSEIARYLRSTGTASCGDKYFANVQDLFLVPILKDLNSLPHLMRKIGDDNSLHCFVVDALITHLLAAKQMQQLQLLLNGALKDSSAGEAYPYGEVKNLVLNTSVYNKSLITACHLLRLLFPLPGTSNCQYRKGMQIIKAAIIRGDLNKVKMMCKLWSSDKRIVLRKADKDDLLHILHRNGELSKQQFVTTLLEKESYLDTKARRNKPGTVEKSITDKIVTNQNVRQKPMGNTNSINQKRMGEILQNALHSGDLEKAKEIWVAGSEHVSLSVGLLLAEKLYFSKMMDEFKSVLLKLRDLHGDLSFHLFTACDSSDARMMFLSETSTVLNLHSNVKQELCNRKVNTFHKLIVKGKLIQALNLSKIISAEKNSVFGRFDLMGAAIDRGDTMIISEVLKLITTYHGKKSSLADFSIALLERYQKALAMRLIHSSGFRLSGAKLNYYIDREIDLNRIDVILDLFECCIPKRNLEQRDLERAVSKIVTLCVKRKDKVMINLVEGRLKDIGILLTAEVNSLLLKSKKQNFGNKNEKNALIS